MPLKFTRRLERIDNKDSERERVKVEALLLFNITYSQQTRLVRNIDDSQTRSLQLVKCLHYIPWIYNKRIKLCWCQRKNYEGGGALTLGYKLLSFF